MLIRVKVERIVYAHGEVGKAADSAALAVASQINVHLYRETGKMVFLPDVFDTAHAYASTNSSYLSSRSIPVTVTGISINKRSRTISD